MSFASAARNYRSIGLESRMADPEPHTLVLMLFDGALERIGLARQAIESNDLPRKIAAIASALKIVEGLRQSLNHEAGGDLAANLDALYEHVGRRLVHANLHNDAGALRESHELLSNVRSGWAQIAGKA